MQQLGYGVGRADPLEDDVPLEDAVSAHLTRNSWPAYGPEWVRPITDAVEAVSAGDSDEQIDLPNGLTVSARDTVRMFRVEALVLVDADDFEDGEDFAFFEDDDTDGEDEPDTYYASADRKYGYP